MLDAVDVTRPVGVDEPAHELVGMGVDDALLPRHERDPPLVLAARTVLGEQAGPVLPVRRDIEDAGVHPRLKGAGAPTHVLDRECDPPGDVEVQEIARHSQPVDPPSRVDEVSVADSARGGIRTRMPLRTIAFEAIL
jgi:hypothetical protein